MTSPTVGLVMLFWMWVSRAVWAWVWALVSMVGFRFCTQPSVLFTVPLAAKEVDNAGAGSPSCTARARGHCPGMAARRPAPAYRTGCYGVGKCCHGAPRETELATILRARNSVFISASAYR